MEMSEVYLGTDVLHYNLCCNKMTRCTKIVGFLFIFLPLNNSVKLLLTFRKVVIGSFPTISLASKGKLIQGDGCASFIDAVCISFFLIVLKGILTATRTEFVYVHCTEGLLLQPSKF